MPKIQTTAPRVAPRTPTEPRRPSTPAASTSTPAASTAWGTGGASRYPAVATNAKNFVDAFALPANSQMEMVASSQATNKAADALLKEVATELSSQLTDRGQDAEADKVMKDLGTFMKKAGPAKGYYVDPDRGSMAALEDNGDRMTKVMGQLAKLTTRLEKVNADPSAENQSAYNRCAAGSAVAAEANFALKFEKAYNGSGADDALVKKAQTFFKALPKKVDAQIESRGGSMEPLERSGGTTAALNDFAASLPTQ